MKLPRSCGFLIVTGDPVSSFLLMEHEDRWDLPKGHVDPGETDLQCALRELIEETGIPEDVLTIDPDFCYESHYQVAGKRYGLSEEKVEKTLRIFLGCLSEDVEIAVTEHIGFEWFPWEPPHDIQERAINPLLRYVEDYVQNQAGSMPS